MPSIPERMLGVLDNRQIARIQALLFIGGVLLPAVAAVAAGVVFVVIALLTTVAWELLILPSIGLFLLLWLVFGAEYRRRAGPVVLRGRLAQPLAPAGKQRRGDVAPVALG